MDYHEIDYEATLEDIDKFIYDNKKIGVIVHVEDSEGKILLQQRESKSRDENGLFEDIGGKFDDTDLSFREAIIREFKEEAGEDVNLQIGRSVGIYHCFKNNTNWVFVIYFGNYIDGEFKVMEPDKCLGYKFFTKDEALSSDVVTESCKYLIDQLA